MRRFRACKYGFIALGISILEIILICGGLAVIDAMGLWGHAPLWLRDAFGTVYMVGMLGLVLSVVGLIKDSRRIYAFLALILGLVSMAICSPLFTV